MKQNIVTTTINIRNVNHLVFSIDQEDSKYILTIALTDSEGACIEEEGITYSSLSKAYERLTQFLEGYYPASSLSGYFEELEEFQDMFGDIFVPRIIGRLSEEDA